MAGVIYFFVVGLVGALIGNRKGRLGLGLLLGVLLGPIGILIMVIVKGNRKKCPFCKEIMSVDAIRCPHCQKDIGKSKSMQK